MSTKNIHEPKKKVLEHHLGRLLPNHYSYWVLGASQPCSITHSSRKKALHSSWASPAKGQLLSGDGQQSLAGQDGMGRMRNLRECGTEPGAPIWGAQLLES